VCYYITICALSYEQDKWRNINVTAIWGSRQKAKLALKKNLPPPKNENNHHPTSTAIVQYNPEVAAPKPLAVSGGISTSKEQKSRLLHFKRNIFYTL